MYAALAVANLSTSAATHPQLLEEEVLRHGSLVLSKKRLEVDLKNFFLGWFTINTYQYYWWLIISWPSKGTSRMSSIVQYSAGGKVLRFQRLPWLPCLANSSCWGCDGLSWDVWELNAFDIAAVCTTNWSQWMSVQEDVPLPGAGQEASSASHGLDKVTFYGQ